MEGITLVDTPVSLQHLEEVLDGHFFLQDSYLITTIPILLHAYRAIG